MKEVYKLDVYQLAEELSDKIWYAYDFPALNSQFLVSSFQFQLSWTNFA